MNAPPETLRRLYGPDHPPLAPTHEWQLQGALIHGLAVLPGEELFVSASEDGTLVVASLADGSVVQQLVGHDGPVNSLCLTPDRTRLITGGDDHTVRVWDARDWQELHVLTGHGAYVREVAVSDAVIVSGSEDDTVRFWDLSDGRELQVGEAHREHLRTVAMAPDGRRAASSGLDHQVIVWDALRGEVERTLYDGGASVMRIPNFGNLYISSHNETGRGHRDAPRRLLFLDGGRTLASIEHDVIFWDLETGEEKRRWPRWGWEHEDVALHPDGRLLVLAGHGYVQVWDLAAGELVTSLVRGGEQVTALAFTPDGRRLLVGTAKGAVQVWDFEAGLRAAGDGCAHQHSITALATRGSRALTCDTGGGVVLWDLEAPGPLRALDVEREANGRALALGEGVALTAESKGFAVWDAATGELRRRVACEQDDASPTPHAFAPLTGERALVGFLGKGIALHGFGEAGEAQPLAGQTQQISILAVSPDERHAVSSGYFERAADVARAKRKSRGEYVYVRSVSHLQGWDLETRELLWTVPAGGGEDYTDFVFCLFTPDGRLVTRSGEDERELAFWDPRTGAVLQTVRLPGDYPTATRLTDRELVTLIFETGQDGEGTPCTMVAIDLATATIAREQPLGRLVTMNAVFSPDGTRLASGSRETLDIYDTTTGERVARYAVGANVRELSFTDDGRRIVLGDQAGRVHILELEGWQPTPPRPWTPEEIEALQRETAARKPVRPAPRAVETATKAKPAGNAKTKTAVKTKSATRKSTPKKPAAKTSPARKTTAKKSTAKKTTAKKTTAKKTTAKKSTAKKSTVKKSVTKKPAAKQPAR